MTTPTLGYPESNLTTCTCAAGGGEGGTYNLSHHERCPMRQVKVKKNMSAMVDNPINPAHYKTHPSGIEAIVVCEHMSFCVGNAMKYMWRAGLKTADPIEDLKKARWYLEREIERLTKAKEKGV